MVAGTAKLFESLLTSQSWRIRRLNQRLDGWRVGLFRILSRFVPPDKALVIVSGANHKYFRDALQLLDSVYAYEADSKVIFYDLGLTDEQRNELADRYPLLEIRVFDYSRYPAYFDITNKAGEYAWKPVIIAEVFEEFRSQVVWMDSRNVLTSHLNDLRQVIRINGVYSPISSKRVGEMTHSDTLRWLRVTFRLTKRWQLNGALVAFRYASRQARQIVNQWRECALTRDCIAPVGSDRSNHRQDQSVLSILCYQQGVTRFMPRQKLDVLIHQDVD